MKGVLLVGAAIYAASSQVYAAAGDGGRDHFGLVLEGAAEFGGDDVAKVFYEDGSTQNIRAGQGVTLGGGVHYQLGSAPFDFAATVGYKFEETADYHTNLGMDRVVVKLTGTYLLPHNLWVDAGPVWHTSTKLNGDGYIPDIKFDDAVGVMVGLGWRWFGISYTHIDYKGPFVGSVDGSNTGVTFAWKF